MRVGMVLSFALLVVACDLGDKFQSHDDAGDTPADLSSSGVAVDMSSDISTMPNADLSGADLSMPAGPAPLWTSITSPIGTKFLNAAWGTGADNVFIVGEAGTILHSTDQGATWSGGVGVGGNYTLRGIWGDGVGAVFVVGDSGAILHSTNGGTTWTAANSITPAFSGSFEKVWGSSANNVFAVGDKAMIYRSTDGGATWVQSNGGVVNTTNPSTTFQGIWGSGPNDIYVVGGPPTIYHSTDGVNWTHQNGASNSLWGIWGSSATDVYATGAFEILQTVNHGSSWTSQAGQISIYADKIAGVGPGTFYLLDDQPDAAVYYVTNGGTTLSRIPNTGIATNAPVVNIWASGPTDVYVVGQGLIVHGHK
jgi:photosystem II stability/assembly factor-like uncharacterized protein